jgi:hypothetical protein
MMNVNLQNREEIMKKYILFFVCFLLTFSFLFVEDIEGKEPVLSSVRWDSDIRIGDRDSVNAVVLDVDYSNGNLFAALKNTESGSDYWSVNISVDTGRTWTETGFMGPGIGDIDAAVLNDYFYIVYTIGSRALIRRFSTDNGSWDIFYGTDTVTYSGFNIREIALASTQDFSTPTGLHFFVIRFDNSLEYHYSSEDVETWNVFAVVSLIADRALDACCNEGYSSEYVWCSYIGTNDSIYIGSFGSAWNSYGPLTDAYYSIGGLNVTSIGAYGDTVMVLYPYCGGEFTYSVNSCASYDGGGTWDYEGTLFGPTGTTSGASTITAREGDGFGVVITSYNFGLYRHRNYPAGEWSDTVHFTDDLVRPQVKPAIERISTNSCGIIYVDHPTMGAWFDISQWPPGGVQENLPGENLLSTYPTVFGYQTLIEYTLSTRQNISLDVYNILGSRVKNLIKGEVPAGSYSASWDGKDDSGKPVASGVYLCVLKTDRKQNIRKRLMLIR